MAMKTVNGRKAAGVPRVVARPAPGLAPKNGGMQPGTAKPSTATGAKPPMATTGRGSGTFKHPKSSY